MQDNSTYQIRKKKKKKRVRTPNWKLIGPQYSSSADAED